MSTKIFGVDIATIVNKTFDGKLHAITLHKVAHTIDAYGATVESVMAHPAEGIRSKWDSKVIVNRGWPAETAKIIILAQSTLASPVTGDRVVTLGGERWQIIHVEQDPVGATWVVAGVLDKRDLPEPVEADIWDATEW